MQTEYFKAAIPEPYRIFGVQLLPLSLGRYQLLKRFDCAFVSDTEESATLDDLLLGILICSMPVREFVEFIGSERWEPELRRWGQRIREEIAADPHFSLLAKFGLFQAYIQEHSKVPRYWDEHPEAGGSGADWSQNLEVGLRAELGYTSEEIAEGPLSKALFDYFKHAENLGLVRLIRDEDLVDGKANADRLSALLKGAPCLA